MEFSESETTTRLRAVVREVVRREVMPLEPVLRREGFVAGLPRLARARAVARETGLFAAFMPKEVGGAGLSLLEFAPLSEELGRSPLGHYVFNCQAPDAGNMELLHQYGTDEQKEKFLLPLVRGDVRSTFTMTEPENAGSNPVWLSTTAVRDGQEWVIRGHKWFSTGADGASFAICMATTNPERKESYARASMLIVPTATPGFERVQNLSVMGERGGDWASHGEIVYRDVRIPLGNILGGDGMGFVLAQERLGPGRIHHCMRWIGVCERAFDILCRHAVERKLAPGRPLGTKQMVQAWIAESRAEIHAARLMVLHAAWKIEREGSLAARTEISLIKFTVARTMQRVLDRALQALGGLGMTDETPIAFWWAHERAARIYDGADEVHLESVAKRLLREYGMREALQNGRGQAAHVGHGD
jgi:alkylation response protein AidB-like acyl-CoA dehydrogenase